MQIWHIYICVRGSFFILTKKKGRKMTEYFLKKSMSDKFGESTNPESRPKFYMLRTQREQRGNKFVEYKKMISQSLDNEM